MFNKWKIFFRKKGFEFVYCHTFFFPSGGCVDEVVDN